MTEKTRKFEIEEAYVQGYNDAVKEFPDLIERIEKWQARPESALVYAIHQYIKDILKEITQGIEGKSNA